MQRHTFTFAWDHKAKSQKLACQAFVRAALDQARKCTLTGIAAFCLTQAEYTALHPNVPRTMLNPPGEMPAGNARHAWERLTIAYETQEHMRNYLSSYLASPAAEIPTDILRSMEDGEHGMSTRSLEWIFTFLKNYCRLTFTDIDDLRALLAEPWDQTQEIRTFVHDKEHILRTLAGNHCRQCDYEVYCCAKKWFNPVHWAQCWTDHARTHQTLADLNVDELFAAIISYKETSLQHMTIAQTGYHAAAAITETTQVSVAEAVAAAMTAYAIKHQPAAQWKHYCWTHGPSNNSQHTSKLCTNPDLPKHRKDATILNRMGGREKHWREK